MQIYQDPRQTMRQQALQNIIGGIGNIQAQRQQAEQQTLRQQALDEERRNQRGLQAQQMQMQLAQQGIAPDEAQQAGFQQFVESGDTSGLSSMLQPVASRAQEQQAYKRQQDALNRQMQMQDRMLNTQVKQAQLAKARQAPEPKESQYKAAGFVKRAEQAEKDLAALGQNFTPDVFQEGMIGGLVPEAFRGEDTKLFNQAKNNFISAVLRKESGAAISDDEFTREEAKYFPQAGDSAEVLAQKARARQQAMNNLKAESGGAYDRIASVQGSPQRQYASAGNLQNINMATQQEIPYAPSSNAGFGNAYAADNAEIVTPERTQFRRSRLQELRQKAGM